MTSTEVAPPPHTFHYPGRQYKIRRGEKGGLYIRGPHENVIYLKSSTVPDDLKALNRHLYDDDGVLHGSVQRQFDVYWSAKTHGAASDATDSGPAAATAECDGRLDVCERRSAQLSTELDAQRSREQGYKSAIKKMEEEQKFAADENKYLMALLDTADRNIKAGREHASRRVAELEARVADLVSERDYLVAQQEKEEVQKRVETKSGARSGGGTATRGDIGPSARASAGRTSPEGKRSGPETRRSKSATGSRSDVATTSVLARQIEELETTLTETRAQLARAQAASDDQRDKIHVAREETQRLRERLAEAQRRITDLETDLKQAQSDYAESERKYKVATAALATFRRQTPPPNSSDEDRVIDNLKRKMQELGAKNRADLQILQQTSAERDRALQEQARLQRDNDVIRIVLNSQRPAAPNRALSAPAPFANSNSSSSSKRNLSAK